MPNYDAQEIAKFDAIAATWWDTNGDFGMLHRMNPLRLQFIRERANGLVEKKALDVACGGGILSEALAAEGASVTGIDLSEDSLQTAKLHLLESKLKIDYQFLSAEDLATKHPQTFDVITCLELLEHVPDPAAIVKACSDLVKPNGDVFFSTLNRHPKSYLMAILGAEYLLKLVPRGTHDYGKFIRPSELDTWVRANGLEIKAISGIEYNPLTKHFFLSSDVKVNYIVHCKKVKNNIL